MKLSATSQVDDGIVPSCADTAVATSSQPAKLSGYPLVAASRARPAGSATATKKPNSANSPRAAVAVTARRHAGRQRASTTGAAQHSASQPASGQWKLTRSLSAKNASTK